MTFKIGKTLLPLCLLLLACGDRSGGSGDPVDAGVDGAAPDTRAPDLVSPDAPRPDQLIPDQASPDFPVPDQMVPDQMVPDQMVPDQMVPDQMVPDQLVPDQYVHDQYVHDQYVHDQYVHDQYVHDQYVHDQYVHDQYVPDMPWPTCSDKVKNQDETDVDCGGKTCPACAVTKKCKLPGDCKSQVCFMGVCVDPKGAECTGTKIELYAGGGFTTSRVHAAASPMRGIGGITAHSDGTLYGQDPYGNGNSGDRVLKITTAGAVSTLTAPSGMSTCTVNQITIDGSGALYLYNITSHYLMKINRTTGSVTNWLNLSSVGGGGSCNNTSVIGLVANADGSLFAGSPKRGKIYKVPKTGGTWGTFATLKNTYKLDHDGAGGLIAAANTGQLYKVSSAGTVSTLLDPTKGPGGARSLRRDSAGDIYFISGQFVYRINSAATVFTPVAGCLGSPSDLHFAKPTSASSTGTSLYISTLGKGIAAFDGDQILELQR